MRHVKIKRYFNKRVAIDIENTVSEPSVSDEPNTINDRIEGTPHEHVVEKYLQSLLKPMDLMQVLFVCARYKIQDNTITPNTRLYSVLSVCASVILMALIYILSFMTPNKTGMEVFHYSLVNIYDFILFSFGVFLNAVTNIEQRFKNVSFVLKIQNVHRILKVNGRYYKGFIVMNWFCVIAINCFHFFWMIMYLAAFNETGIANIIINYTCIRFDMNMIYATRNMKLVYNALESWIEELQSSGFVDDTEDDQYWDSMFQGYVDIIQVFEIVEKNFHRLVLFYLIHWSSNTLFDIWIRVDLRPIVTDSGDFQYAILTCVSLTWVIKNLTLLISLCMEGERFYSGMAEVQSICVQIFTSERCSETRKRFCKNIQRVQDATFKKMEVCGLFTIDAELPINALGLITTYTIVLLQFEFL